MKKTLIYLLLLSISLPVFSQNRAKMSHWSLTLEGGLNKFDGDIKQDYNDIIPNSAINLSYGASLEYTIYPAWTIGVDYYNLPVNANGFYYSLKNQTRDAGLFTGVNILKAFNRDTKTKWGLWATLGAGLSFYSVDYETTIDGPVSINSLSGYYGLDYDQHFTDGRALVIPIGAILEYNFSKSLALGTKIQYRAYNKDNMDGRNYWGVTNDYIALGTLQLRWKFNAKNKEHVRNLNQDKFNSYDNTIDNDILALQNKVADQQKELDALKPSVNKIRDVQPSMESIPELKKRIADLESRLAAPAVTAPTVTAPAVTTPAVIAPEVNTDGDGDGVPDNRDREPNTPANTAVDFWGRSIKGYEVDDSGVYFGFDKSDIDAAGYKAISLVAEKMKADPSLIVEVRGFADYVGTPEYNIKLSQRRADKVKKELMTKYNIDSARIIANGKGRLLEPKTEFKGNRRCSFFYDK